MYSRKDRFSHLPACEFSAEIARLGKESPPALIVQLLVVLLLLVATMIKWFRTIGIAPAGLSFAILAESSFEERVGIDSVCEAKTCPSIATSKQRKARALPGGRQHYR